MVFIETDFVRVAGITANVRMQNTCVHFKGSTLGRTWLFNESDNEAPL